MNSKDLKLPNLELHSVYAAFWAKIQSDAPNVASYLKANYCAKGGVSSENLSAFGDGVVAFFAYCESCLLDAERKTSKTDSEAKA